MADTNGEKKPEPGAKALAMGLNVKNLLIAAIIALCIAFAGLVIWTKKHAAPKSKPSPSPSVFQKMSAPYRRYSAPQKNARPVPERVSPMPSVSAKTGAKARQPAFKPNSSAKKPMTPTPVKSSEIQSPVPQPATGQEKDGAEEESSGSIPRKKVKVYDSDSVTEGGIFTEKNGMERPVNRLR